MSKVPLDEQSLRWSAYELHMRCRDSAPLHAGMPPFPEALMASAAEIISAIGAIQISVHMHWDLYSWANSATGDLLPHPPHTDMRHLRHFL